MAADPPPRPPPRPPAPAHVRAALAGRFAATIPLTRPVIVDHLDAMGLSEHRTAGLPAYVRGGLLYVTVKPGAMVAILLAHLIDIQPMYPAVSKERADGRR